MCLFNDVVWLKAIAEIQRNYEELNEEQRDFISVDPNDFFFRFIYETGMIFDDKSGTVNSI